MVAYSRVYVRGVSLWKRVTYFNHQTGGLAEDDAGGE